MEDGIRFATMDEERRAVRRLRYEILAGELRTSGSLDHDAREDRSPADAYNHLVLAVEDGRPAGTVRLHWGQDAPFDADEQLEYEPGMFGSAPGC